MHRLILCLALATLVAAQKPVLVNDLVDRQMDAHNKLLTRHGMGLTKISQGKMNDIEFSEGVQLGVNTLKRTGDSFAVRVSEDTTSYKYMVGYDLLLFAFGKITVDGKPMSGYFRPKVNALQFDFTVKNGTTCSVTMDEYKFSKMESLDYELSEKVKLPANFPETLLSHVNAALEEKKAQVERHLQHMCRPSSIPNGRPEVVGPALAATTERPTAA